MSNNNPPTTKNYKLINGSGIIEKLEFMDGVSSKTGNAYLIPALYIKSPVSDQPLRLEFSYIDPNVSALLRMALEKDQTKEIDDFLTEVKE